MRRNEIGKLKKKNSVETECPVLFFYFILPVNFAQLRPHVLLGSKHQWTTICRTGWGVMSYLEKLEGHNLQKVAFCLIVDLDT